jgi:hypothetical protein
VGLAFDPERATGVPLTIAIDADLRTYEAAAGPRRVVAVGVEQWLLKKRWCARGRAYEYRGGDERRVGDRRNQHRPSPGHVPWKRHLIRGGADDEKAGASAHG